MLFRSLFAGSLFFAASTSIVLAAPVAEPAAPAPALKADQIPAPVVIVIDIQFILEKSTAAQGIRDERDKYLKAYQQEFSAAETELGKMRDAIAKQEGVLSRDAFAAKVKEFDAKAAEFQGKVQSRRRALEQSYGTAMTQVQQTLVQITDQVAGEVKANLVLNKAQTFLLDPKMDVSAAVVDRLNKTLPTVSFPVPLEAPSGADKEAGKDKPSVKPATPAAK